RRGRTPRSGRVPRASSRAREVRIEPPQGSVPCVLGGGLVVRVALIAVEAVLRIRIPDDLGRDRCGSQRLAKTFDGLDRYRLVPVIEQPQPWSLKLRGLAHPRWELREPRRHRPPTLEAGPGPEPPPEP